MYDTQAESNKTAQYEKHEQLTFLDEREGQKLEYNPIKDNDFYKDYIPDASLANFLSRPVLIHTISWPQGSSISGAILPWQLYFNNPTVKRKLDNYAFISCNLKIKIIVNASPFYYGAMMFNYKPMYDFNACPIDTVNLDANSIVMLESQRPTTYIYPQYCQGSEMTFPFFYIQNWLSATTNYDFGRIGQLLYRAITPLENANSVAGTDVDVQIYAWAEDVRVMGPTNSLSLQSEDEYVEPDGLISATASALANKIDTITSWLPPVYQPYAMATSMIAQTTARVAQMFGYTNTPIIESVKPFKDLPFHSLASADISQPVEKLTLDPKNELTIDPRVVGLDPEDELALAHIVGKPCILDRLAWQASNATDHLLFSTRVMPNLSRYTSFNSGQLAIARPFCAHISQMFRYWRGDMIFSFKFILTKYHKGRVRITWDPSADIQLTADTQTTNINRIIDISQENHVDIRIPYAQSTAWQRNQRFSSQQFTAGAACPLRDPSEDNGVLTLRVLNPQTSPVTIADIDIIVSVRMAENAEFSNQLDLSNFESVYQPQSKDELELQSADEMIEITTPEDLFESNKKMPEDYPTFIGETNLSLRKLMRRSVMYEATYYEDLSNTLTGLTVMDSRWGRLPRYNGFDPNGTVIAEQIVGVSVAPYNLCKPTHLNHISSMFVGVRGSVIYHKNTDATEVCTGKSVSRDPNVQTANRLEVRDYTGDSAASSAGITRYSNGFLSGGALYNERTQAGLSVLAPMYNRNRFQTTAPAFRTNGSLADDSSFDFLNWQSKYAREAGRDFASTEIYYVSAGPDFTCHFLLNVPTMYRYTSEPVVP